MIKILFLTSSYPSTQNLVNRTFMSELAETLSAHAIQVYVLCPHGNGLPYRKKEGNITIIRFPYWFTADKQRLGGTGGLMASIDRSPMAVLQLIPFCVCQFFVSMRIIREEKIDLIHSHWIVPQGFLGAVLNLVWGIPHIASVHGTDVHLIHHFHVAWPVLRFIAGYAGWITTNSSHTCRLVQDTVPTSDTKTSIIPMGIYPEEYSNDTQRSPGNEKIILYIGRLIPWKGVRILIEAIKISCNLQFQIRLIIVGDGPEREDLEELSQKLKIDHMVTFTGNIERTTLLTQYQKADLFVLPSVTVEGQTEGLGVVLLEAMAAGVPVIGSRTGGIPDIIEDGVNGLLVPPGDPGALADAILSILSDPDLADRFRAAGLQTIQERFSWDSIADRFIQVYKKALYERDPARRR